jgi:glutaredoxin-related protein
MSNYQTDFLNALSITSQSLSGLMRDIREPDFQDKLRMQEESQKRLNQQAQEFALERMDVGQQFTLEQMDESQQDTLERIGKQGMIQLENTKAIDEFRSTLGREDAVFYDDLRRTSAFKDQDAQFEYMKKNYKKIIKLDDKIQKFANVKQYKTRRGTGLGIPNFLYDKTKGFIRLPGVGTDKLAQSLQGRQYQFETGLQLGRQDAFMQAEQDRKDYLEAVYNAAGVSPEFKEEHSSTQEGLNAYYGGMDFNDPASMLAARNLMSIHNQGIQAQMIVDNQKAFALNNVLQQGQTPDFDINQIVGNVTKSTPRDRFFGRSPNQRMELAEATKNSYASSLGLATMQAQYALQDKFGGINRSRQKEALKDLIEAKSLAERLMKDTKFGSTSKENIERHKKYYGDSIKMLNTWIQALQR